MDTDTSSTSAEIPLLTFNSLYNILREEKKGKTLQSLPERFYEALDKFLHDKKEEIKKLREENEKEKLKRERHVYHNSLKIGRELISLRATKIANVGIKNDMYEEEVLSTENILPEEQTIVTKLSEGLSSLKIHIDEK